MTFDELALHHGAFVERIKSEQVAANSGWKKPPTDFVDRRVFTCPTCKAPGLNTCFGYVAFTCGSEWMPDGDDDWSESKPCDSPHGGKE